MNIHHVKDSDDNSPKNLATICVACHAIFHIGLNLGLKTIEIWESTLSQKEIVQLTRDGIKKGLTLRKIKTGFDLKKGEFPPKSMNWANSLISNMGNAPRKKKKKPLCVVFV
ncbi:MAG: hypothetical protein HY202_08870, partial [Nitrospirae bacterium]|nr:hypothetical protein [Nitrospirota bacterium]